MFEIFRRGERLTPEGMRQKLNSIPNATLQQIIPGPGITIQHYPDGSVISARGINVKTNIFEGGGMFPYVYVLELPPVPTDPVTLIVFWCSNDTGLDILGASGGTGNDALWIITYPQTVWRPLTDFSAQSGEVET